MKQDSFIMYTNAENVTWHKSF